MNNFGIQNKNNFDFYIQTWKNRKTAGAIGLKILKQLPLAQANLITTEVFSMAKDPSNYKDREVQKIEKVPIDIEITDDDLVRPKMVSVNNTVNKNVIKQRATNEQHKKM